MDNTIQNSIIPEISSDIEFTSEYYKTSNTLKKYYPSLNLEITYYANGLGNIKKLCYYNDKNEYNGIYREFHNDSKIKVKGTYINGKKDGIWEHKNKKGFYLWIFNYKLSVYDGECKTFHDNGQIKSFEIYKNGKKDGNFIYWHDNGKEKYTHIYENDVLISTGIKYARNGDIIK